MPHPTFNRFPRRAPRVPVTLLATVLRDAGGQARGCLVQDFSEGGAKLTFPGVPALTQRFQLLVPRLDRVYEAELRWQSGQDVGVAFSAAMPM